MEAGTAGFFQETLRGFWKCLGLEGGGGNAVAGGVEVANNPLPPSSPPLDPAASTTYEPLPAADDTPTLDPLVDVLSSPIDSTTAVTTTNSDNNLGAESNFTLVTIDEIINTSGGTVTEAQYVELGQPNKNLYATSLISSAGGGKSH